LPIIKHGLKKLDLFDNLRNKSKFAKDKTAYINEVVAVVYTQYGSPDVLQFKEVEKPIPKDNEVLIRIVKKISFL